MTGQQPGRPAFSDFGRPDLVRASTDELDVSRGTTAVPARASDLAPHAEPVLRGMPEWRPYRWRDPARRRPLAVPAPVDLPMTMCHACASGRHRDCTGGSCSCCGYGR